MNQKIMELIENNESFHAECSSKMSKELEAHFIKLPEACVFRRDAGLYEYMRVKEYLSFFARLTLHKDIFDSAVEAMHLTDMFSMKISQCTVSQRIRILIARLILLDPRTYFMIEPLRELDEDAMRMVISWMAREIDDGKRVITVSPSLKEICLCPGKHYYISDKGIELIDSDEAAESENDDSLLLSRLSVKSDGNIFLFNPEEVDYVEAKEGKCYVYVRRESYISQMTLDELEDKLKGFGFYRCHRSYLVNIQKVTEIVRWTRSSYSLRLSNYNEYMVPLSKAKIQELKNTYQF